MSQLGISFVPKPMLEAGQPFGATPLQMLWRVQLPSAAAAIVAGMTQCIMLSLSMVVIAALVGAGDPASVRLVLQENALSRRS